MEVTSFGEALWGGFPNGRVLGDISLSVAVRLQSPGIDVAIISRCGSDANGEELLHRVQSKNVNTDYLQVCQEYATSLVKIHLNKSGSVSYEIVYPCTWGRISNDNAAIKRMAEFSAFVFSSLATRDEIPRKSLDVLLKEAKFKIFGINLRKSHHDTDRLLEIMKQSDMVGLNDDEPYELVVAYGSPYYSIEQNISYLVELTGARILCVTLGSHDAVLYKDDEMYRHCGFRVKAVDTVGSDDSFLGGLAHKLLNNVPSQEAITSACALGVLATSCHGVTADISLEEAEASMDPA